MRSRHQNGSLSQSVLFLPRMSRAAPPTVSTDRASMTTLDQRFDPVIRARLILVSQVAMAGIPLIGARGSLGALGLQSGLDLDHTIDTICAVETAR